MKLINKKTGEKVKAFEPHPIDLFIYEETDEGVEELVRRKYKSIKELYDEWEEE